VEISDPIANIATERHGRASAILTDSMGRLVKPTNWSNARRPSEATE
jgi:hypothetical protein